MKLCLPTVVLLLPEVFEYFRLITFESYKLDPAKVLTISSTTAQSSLSKLSLEVDVILDIDSLKDFKGNIRGGLFSTIKDKKTYNN